MTKLTDYILLSLMGSATLAFAYWCWRDIKRERRPKVTDAMIEEAYRSQIMTDFDEEFDTIDWED